MDILVIDVALCKTAEAPVVQAKRKTVLEDWDKRRAVELGDETGPWEVIYCSTGGVKPSVVLFFLVFFSLLFCLSRLRNPTHPQLRLDPKAALAPLYAPQGGQIRQVRCEKTELKDVHVPLALLSNQPHVKSRKESSMEEAEDWNLKIGELFEWVGMACLGSQR
jgi:ribonuclease P/MRP protein subunit RPP40